MLETEVAIEFECCHCQHPITARLKCSGAGVSTGPHAVAGVHLPCPDCHKTNQVCFELTGLVLAVRPRTKSRPLLEPSLN